MNSLNDVNSPSFEYTGVIGGNDIDLKDLAGFSDTLLGAAMNELTAALGTAENPYEQYHQGDGGISDIVLQTFDSALLIDGNVKLYTENQGTTFDNTEEMAAMMGKKIDKKESANAPKKVEEDLTKNINSALENLDKITKHEVNASWMLWHDSKVVEQNADGELEFVDDENDFTDEDFDDDAFLTEMEHINEEAKSGEFDHILNRTTLTPISKEPNIRIVK